MLFMERIIVAAMHAEGKNTRFIPEDLRSSVSLVYIQIDHQNLSGFRLLQQVMSCQGNVIEQAEALPPVAVSMLGAAGDVHADAGLQGK